MKTDQRMLAFDYRSGHVTKEGSNKGKEYVSFTGLDFDGNKFDFFCWNDDGRFPRKIDVPCLLHCTLSVDVTRDNKIEVGLLFINEKSSIVDLGALIDSLKIKMEKV